MALRPDSQPILYALDHWMNTTGEAGGIVCYNGNPSGVAMDQGENTVGYLATASGGKPAGVLLNEVVDIDLSKYHINWYRDQVNVGGKVTVLKQGEVTTNMIVSGQNPSAGSSAYLGANGRFSTTGATDLLVGKFVTGKDEDGYAKVTFSTLK